MKTAVFLLTVERRFDPACFNVRLTLPETGATTETRATSVQLAMREVMSEFLRFHSNTIARLERDLP